jgi:hypothetical protein
MSSRTLHFTLTLLTTPPVTPTDEDLMGVVWGKRREQLNESGLGVGPVGKDAKWMDGRIRDAGGWMDGLDGRIREAGEWKDGWVGGEGGLGTHEEGEGRKENEIGNLF